MTSAIERHAAAARTHERAAVLHDLAASRLEHLGDPEAAALARRRASYQRTGRDIERDHVALLTRRGEQPRG